MGFDPSIVSQTGRFLVRPLLVKLSRSVRGPTLTLTLGEEGHSDGDELPLGEQSSKENIRKDDEIRATQMGAEAEVPRVRDFTV